MSEEKFLKELEKELFLLKEDERKDILRDFKEYFANGRAEGKKEEEIVESFGPIHDLAMELLAAYSEEEFVSHVEMTPAIETGFDNVDIKADKANISIVPSEGDKPIINVKDQDGKTKATMEVVNNTLKIRVKREDSIMSFFFIHLSMGLKTIDVSIQLPQKLYDQMKVESDNGKIEIESQQAKHMKFKTDHGKIHLKSLLASTLKAKTDNGRIVLDHSNFTNVIATTDNGRICVDHSRSEKFELSTDNGRIELNEVSGEIWATTDNGRIEGYIPQVTKPLQWKTDNGSIVLKTDEVLNNVTLSVKSDFGRISVYGEKGKKFQFGDGTIPIRFKTDNGRITVESAVLQEV
ncbi:DUF4097 family beta strand repeat-containing protein [Ureibacillus chungkukjangi]|uniref:DUF4097 family beta strand repeat-containing protein n=1 Tax=Ureibacillus chungkukjangi TaxID=1202712 RepID=UPI002041DF05|nr:DUF4097 family beta strand repeat-containing protein [Ureibacillus chungkukjangi]MCM3389674.1 DUF4097 family beta strand repeat-containing protein [Ureibacillus chungkukjangi]